MLENNLDNSKKMSLSLAKATGKKTKIGFVGTGSFVTSIILKSLLRTGHVVAVWEDTIEELANDDDYGCFKHELKSLRTEKLEDNTKRSKMKWLIREGKGTFEDDIHNCSWPFKVLPDPAAVVEASDVIFSCFLDYESREQALRRDYGLIHRSVLYSSKGYVEMTTIDPETSKQTAEDIQNLQGKYIEVCGWPSVQLADENRLTLFVSGSEELYKRCESILKNMTEHLQYYGTDVGHASHLTLLHHFLVSLNVASLAEMISLYTKLGLDAKTFRFLLEEVLHLPSYLLNEVDAMIEKNYTADTSIDYMKHSLSMLRKVLLSSDASANVIATNLQVYVAAVRKGYGCDDVCAVQKISQPMHSFL